ncbi:XkdX family protein [Limosilactobacillus reuteri]|nr:XkdX family protein [Limosilactobacillus reuteri]MCC4517912.1 XkdX family protein [Limosilactobacillus reuteri]
MFDLVQQSYRAGWYTLDNVRTFVLANMITEDEYKTVTGQDYNIETTIGV